MKILKNTSITLFLFVLNASFCQVESINQKELLYSSDYNSFQFTALIDEKISLSGTLITPKSEFEKILVIISGSGVVTQHHYIEIIEYLLKNNIAVFRYDKRGVGNSTGDYDGSISIYTNDFIRIYEELKESSLFIDKKVGFLAHSYGGVASIEAIQKGIKPDYLIQWSSPIGQIRYVMNYQIKNGLKHYDYYFKKENIQQKVKTVDFIDKLIDDYPDKNYAELRKIAKLKARKTRLKRKSLFNLLLPQNIEAAKLDNTNAYINLNFPTLVIIGTKDIYVSPTQTRNKLAEIKNQNITYKELEGLNHFMKKHDIDLKYDNKNEVDLLFKEYILHWINQI